MIEIRSCLHHDLQAVIDLNEEVYAALPDKSILRHNSPEMIASCLEAPNLTLGVWDSKKLVAIGILYVPNSLDEDHAHDLFDCVDLPALPLKAANQKLFLVKEGYRGLGLQRQLIRKLEMIATERGYNLLCTTCSPNNDFSINNFIKEGYQYAKTEEKYDGLTRNIYYKLLISNI